MKRLVAEMDALTAYKWCAPRAWQDHDPAVQRKGAAGPDKIREGGDGLVCERFRFVLRHTGLRVSASAFAPVSARNSHPRGTLDSACMICARSNGPTRRDGFHLA